jgi:hypothetical protein
VVAGIIALNRTKERLLIKKEFAWGLGVAIVGFSLGGGVSGILNQYPQVKFKWPTGYITGISALGFPHSS